jgi:MbtH protein
MFAAVGTHRLFKRFEGLQGLIVHELCRLARRRYQWEVIMEDNNEDTLEYLAVKNEEEQYSTWASHRSLPPGWYATGFRGSKPECLANISEVWTDMRTLSLRKHMDAVSVGS